MHPSPSNNPAAHASCSGVGVAFVSSISYLLVGHAPGRFRGAGALFYDSTSLLRRTAVTARRSYADWTNYYSALRVTKALFVSTLQAFIQTLKMPC